MEKCPICGEPIRIITALPNREDKNRDDSVTTANRGYTELRNGYGIR